MIDDVLAGKLAAIAATPVLLVASDYDGVLSPIVNDPAAAVPDQPALAALVRLGQLPDTYALAISGRSRDTLVALTGNPPGVTMIGTHGAEATGDAVKPAATDRVRDLQADLLALSKQYPGSEVELKPIGAAFHYRNAAHGGRSALQARAIAETAGARVIAGKKVVECVFGDADKGSALDAFRQKIDATAVVFLGDDTTDEDAFAVLGSGDAGIKVGPGPTLAAYRIPSQQDVALVLKTLVTARRGAQAQA
ncbi:MAG: trehalose-phosphatase [Acidimicrobiia bacterium]|nr:trehalose-phosphatase [Acidimicrobiia bacterium]MDX2467060.1 trehalose-phosphatase [Acidimicrobiia bacterium]